jgi:hypothetical protein
VLLQDLAPLGDLQRIDGDLRGAKLSLQLLGEMDIEPIEAAPEEGRVGALAPAISSATATAKAESADRRGSSMRE